MSNGYQASIKTYKMGYKNVCLSCKRVKSIGTNYNNFKTENCPECLNKMVFINQKFKPPKKTDIKSWKMIEYLIKNGFYFQSITNDNNESVSYPKSIKDAEEFVLKYKHKLK